MPTTVSERPVWGRNLWGSSPPSGGRPNWKARQVLYARQQVHIRLGGVLGRAGIGVIEGIE